MRGCRWTPVWVTLSDPVRRGAVLELYAPNSDRQALNISERVPMGSTPLTFPIYAPLIGRLDDCVLKVREMQDDGSPGKLLHDEIQLDQIRTTGMQGINNDFVDEGSAFIALSGQQASLTVLEGGLGMGGTVVYVPPKQLPRFAKGYDCFDLLILNAPDLGKMDLTTQTAIADWVRGGGRLILWLNDDPVPPLSPIGQLLPAQPGRTRIVKVPHETLTLAGIIDRFDQLKIRDLTPDPGAEQMQLFPLIPGPVNHVQWEVKAPIVSNDYPREFIGLRERRGLGQIELLSFDVSSLPFRDGVEAMKFWRPLLTGLVPLHDGTDSNRSFSNAMQQSPEKASAAAQVMDWLGDVPGVGKFGFSYVAAVLLMLIVLVGPVDWFVLKKMGRQPWTWITTAGWIALITVGGIFIGHMLKSGDLYYRTVRIIDQADGEAVGTLDVAAIYSPRTTDYRIDAAPEGWWQPLSASEYFYRGSGMMTKISCTQNPHDAQTEARSNLPEEMTINVWNLRFLEGDKIARDQPMIEAKLLQTGDRNNAYRLTGMVTNIGTQPLRHMLIRTSRGLYRLPSKRSPTLVPATGGTGDIYQDAEPIDGLPPGASIAVDLFVNANDSFLQPLQRNTNYGGYSTSDPPARDDESHMRCALGMAVDRARRIDELMASSQDLACVYALSSGVPPSVKLDNPQAIQEHWQVIRALVPLAVNRKPE